jgi:hypothetical protein
MIIPMPPKQTHPNGRAHFRTKAKYVKRQREEGFIAAIEALSKARSISAKPRWKVATIQATFYKPGAQARVADGDGLNSWLKATADGFQDAGIVANDSGFIWLPAREIFGRDAGTRPQVVITVQPAPAG